MRNKSNYFTSLQKVLKILFLVFLIGPLKDGVRIWEMAILAIILANNPFI